MKKMIAVPSLLVVTLAVIGASAGTVADTPARVSRAVMRSVEDNLNERLSRLWAADTPMALTSHARGLYLDGYGAVFTLEMNIANDGVGLMTPTLTPQMKNQVKQKKIDRMPQLQKTLSLALVDAAATLDPVPLDEQVVIEVDLLRYSWEDGSGYPAELLVQSSRRKLLDVKRANGVGLDAAVHVSERN
ncbi:MAG TPA: hypothetical protein VGG72_12910 [Bryobacteraceae bacterium]|jgi:hypothetical protein